MKRVHYGNDAPCLRRFLHSSAYFLYKLNKLYAGIAEGNFGSQRVLEKNGFELEGRRINHLFFGGKFYNQLDYGLLL